MTMAMLVRVHVSARRMIPLFSSGGRGSGGGDVGADIAIKDTTQAVQQNHEGGGSEDRTEALIRPEQEKGNPQPNILLNAASVILRGYRALYF
jgi:hypothetical protein